MRKPRPPPPVAAPCPPPEIISAATTTCQVIPIPTTAPVAIEGRVAGRSTRRKRVDLSAHGSCRQHVPTVDLLRTADCVDDHGEERPEKRYERDGKLRGRPEDDRRRNPGQWRDRAEELEDGKADGLGGAAY